MHPLTCCQLQGRLSQRLCAQRLSAYAYLNLGFQTSPATRARAFSGVWRLRKRSSCRSDFVGYRAYLKTGMRISVYLFSPPTTPHSPSGKELVHPFLLRCTFFPIHASLLN